MFGVITGDQLFFFAKFSSLSKETFTNRYLERKKETGSPRFCSESHTWEKKGSLQNFEGKSLWPKSYVPAKYFQDWRLQGNALG